MFLSNENVLKIRVVVAFLEIHMHWSLLYIPNVWPSFKMKGDSSDTRGRISPSLWWNFFKREELQVSPVFSLRRLNLLLSVSMCSGARDEACSTHGTSYTSGTGNLSCPLWCTKASSPSSCTLGHSSIHRCCSALLTIQVIYVRRLLNRSYFLFLGLEIKNALNLMQRSSCLQDLNTVSPCFVDTMLSFIVQSVLYQSHVIAI